MQRALQSLTWRWEECSDNAWWVCVCVCWCALPWPKQLLEAIHVHRSHSARESVVFPWQRSEWISNLTMCLFASGKRTNWHKDGRWDVLLYLSLSIKGSNPSKTGHTQQSKNTEHFSDYAEENPIICQTGMWRGRKIVPTQNVLKLLNSWQICYLKLFWSGGGRINGFLKFIWQHFKL